MNRTRLARLGALVGALVLPLASCGGGSSSSGSSKPIGSDSYDAGATQSAGGDDGSGSPYEGLCSWASPEDLEEIFGEPVDALGGVECRVVPADETGSDGFYHLRLDQSAAFDEQTQRLQDNQQSMGFTICDQEAMRWQGLRISRRVTCPTGGGEVDDFGPQVTLELGPGRVLTTLPYEAADQQSAEEASERFVEIMKAFAKGAQGQPLINEVLPGGWVELYNPNGKPVDVSGAVLTGRDTFEDALTDSQAIADGTTIEPGDHLVVGIKQLGGLTGDFPEIELSSADGRFIDVMDVASVTGGEVARRDRDAGVICGFGSAEVTRGTPNPRGCD